MPLNTAIQIRLINRTIAVAIVYGATVFVCGGASCARNRSAIPEFRPPVVFSDGTPTLDDLIVQTNRSLKIETLASNDLTIDSPELAYKLGGNFQWQRPHNLRLETKLFSSALGTPLAVGSNADMFWLQAQRPSPTIYYASYDDFEKQQGPRHVLPVSPLWLREAFGIVELDPSMRHEPPITRADGKVQVISYLPSPRGDYKRVLIMDPATGVIDETHLYNHLGRLIASAQMSDHEYYAAIDWSLPHRVKVQLQPDVGDPLAFEVDIGFYILNQPAGGKDTFKFPDTTGLSAVDLVQANATIQQQSPTSTSPMPSEANNLNQTQPSAPVSLLPPIPAATQTMPPGYSQPASTSPDQNGRQPLVASPPVYRTASGDALQSSWQNLLGR